MHVASMVDEVSGFLDFLPFFPFFRFSEVQLRLRLSLWVMYGIGRVGGWDFARALGWPLASRLSENTCARCVGVVYTRPPRTGSHPDNPRQGPALLVSIIGIDLDEAHLRTW